MFSYFKQSWQEIKKVKWPSRKDSVRFTWAVVVFSIALSGFITFVDFGVAQLFEKVILR